MRSSLDLLSIHIDMLLCPTREACGPQSEQEIIVPLSLLIQSSCALSIVAPHLYVKVSQILIV